MWPRNLSLFTPATLKTVVHPIRESLSNMVYSHPARCATSASPVQSITRFANTACRPDLLSVTMPVISPAEFFNTSTHMQCSRGRTPLSVTRVSATILKWSASKQSESLYGHLVVPPIRSATRSISRPIPSQSTVPSYRYQPSVSIPTVVMTPPKHPYRSRRIVSAPVRRAASAADSPAGPAPTTSTSHVSSTGIFRAGSTTSVMRCSRIACKRRRAVVALAAAGRGGLTCPGAAVLWSSLELLELSDDRGRGTGPARVTGDDVARPSPLCLTPVDADFQRLTILMTAISGWGRRPAPAAALGDGDLGSILYETVFVPPAAWSNSWSVVGQGTHVGTM
eukprot:m.171810 g.171810  ORF g.171810 m.171810 type:complete len:338 (-) comp13428_c0_seq1:398-1411(-)